MDFKYMLDDIPTQPLAWQVFHIDVKADRVSCKDKGGQIG